MGIVSSKIDKDKLLSATKTMKRNENEIISEYKVATNFYLIILHFKNEIFDYNENDKKFIFPEQFSKTYFENHINEINALIVQLTSTNKLEIKADFLGIKQLYYTTENKELLFATELKAILDYYPKEFFQHNEEAILEYTLFQCNWGKNTLFSQIQMIQARELLEYDLKENEVKWKYYEQYPSGFHTENVNERIHELFTYYFKNLNSNGKNIHWLSGGLDSRLILAYLVENKIPIDKIINFGFEKSKNCKFAKKTAEHYNLLNTYSHYQITSEIIVQRAISHLWRTEGYSGHLNAHIPFMLEQIKGEMVIYDGLAGDTILGANHWGKTKTELGNPSTYIRLKLYRNALTPEFFKKLTEYKGKEIERIRKEEPVGEEALLQQFKETRYHENYQRRKSRSGGVKIGEDFGVVHYPFMIKEIYNACIQIPADDRKDHKQYKSFIEQFFPELNKIPSTSLDKKKIRSTTLLAKIFKKAKIEITRGIEYLFKTRIKKQTLYLDPDEWLRDDKTYREMITSVLTSEYTAKRGYFNIKNISEMIEQHMKRKKDFGHVLTKLFDLEITFRLFMDQLSPESCANPKTTE
ncbi:MAG: asparagine synthase-related protein [Candidatus Heimdallarchaeota archaeon]